MAVGCRLPIMPESSSRGVTQDQVWEVFRGHYTRGDTIDVHKFATDLATWGPIASRVVEIQLESGGGMSATPKRLTTQVPQVDICELRRNGWFLPRFGAYRQGDAVTICYRGIVSNVHLVSTAMHLGGRREWFSCPCCGERAGVLYGPAFACRSCQRLNYPSTRQCTRDRAITRAVQLRRQLGGDGSLLEPFPRRPKGMKRKTWWRFLSKANRDEQRWLIGAAAAASTLSAKFGRRKVS
jgi:hypothetical protein